MSKLKNLAAKYERYNISLEHMFNNNNVPHIKATILIPGEGNTFLKRVSTNFVAGTSLQDAEKKAVDLAVDMILGKKLTKKLQDKFSVFDLQLVPFTGTKEAPVGVKVILNVCTDEGKPFRTTVSLATGTDSAVVESDAVKSAINSVLGV